MKPVRRLSTRLTIKAHKWWSLTMVMALLVSIVGTSTAATAATIGQGFTVTPSDLAFILKQIKIAEYHAANTTLATGPCGALLGTGPDQISSPLLSFGLRTVDGSCNNLQSGQDRFGSADQTFPRLTTPVFKPAETNPALFGPPAPSSYAQTSGNVFDSQPRTVSNLIVDQTSANPAAIAAARFPVRTQGNEGIEPCTTEPTTIGGSDGLPLGCVPAHQTLFIPNVTTDVGLSPPFNSLFTIFGQFFDHGLDKVTNGGNGTVFVPLKDDDPLVLLGPDGIAGNGDEVAPGLRFMTLTRATIKPGPDGFRNASNTDTPFVDQSQTYTSHSSHQVFLREYVNNNLGLPVATGKFLSSPDGNGLANWAQIKTQAAVTLGLALSDFDVNNIPMIVADQYGKFIPGPLRGLPQYVTTTPGLFIEGDVAAPVAPPVNVIRIDTAFLNDIAHSAVPTAIPDSDNTAGSSLDTPSPAGSYDDELLNLHFICGDGRCNENIGLTAIHQIFHSEHDRLIDYVKNVLTTDSSGITHLSDWQLTTGATGWNGERLFQAARFVTEMQYQHLVFEEFARKVQPAINPFEPFAFNQTDVNPAVTAEFAHAVYRFGHSMLTETIPRINANGSHNDILLLDGFLNPAAYNDGGPAGHLTSVQAATAIIMGLSDQTGNEIDEFVANTLRNNLLGLPLDLPAINMTRARSEGIPSLNNVRKQINAATNDGQLAPYENWVAFGQAIKHPESLVNFVAAYGTHPNIMTLDPDGAGPILAGGLVARRIAADQIVNGTILPGPDGVLGDSPSTIGTDESLDDIIAPADAGDFMFSSGAWANSGSTSISGLDDVDLWVGGLAENTLVFGGLLGSTFNYVFENQLTNLQNGDRFYYLARTPGMNLRTQLEGNSFAELVMRNTTAVSLKADSFATADCKFNLGSNPGIATPSGSTVTDDPNSECLENVLLLRQPNGEIRYRSTNPIDPPGINGQSVYSGTLGIDRIFGGNDNDTFWGGPSNDIINGGGGDDVVLGGEGNDIITDLGGFDVLKGGPGNDAIDGGVNDDILMGGEGVDFTNGGANVNEAFLGDGDDFAIGGQGTDAVFGDSGDDWEEGGDQPDLLIGDSSTLFFDDHNLPGNDIMIGQGGDDDYDMEGGDDIGVAGPGVEKAAGSSGFDWEIGLADPQAQNADLDLLVVGNPPVNETRDRYNEIEALSGWNLNDTLRGDSIIPSQVAGGGFIGCDALDANGVARITGLDQIVPAAIRTVPAAPIVAAAVTNFCQLTGLAWGEGNILIGGAGSDIIEGRGGDDIIDGDRYVNVRLSVRNPLDNSQLGTTDLMEHAALSGNFGTGTTGMTLQQAVFAGLVDPGNIVAVREILSPLAGTDTASIDTAVFSGALAEYIITVNTAGPLVGSVTVDHQGGIDGIDTLRNIERLQFIDQTVSVNPVPAITTISPATAAANGAAFTLTVNGSGFVSGSVVRWNGVDRSTTFVSSTQLTAAIATADIAAPAGTRSVTVFNPAAGGGLSNAATFTVTAQAANPVPVIAAGALSPNPVLARGAAFTLTVNGSNFVPGSVVRISGINRTTTFVSSTQLTALVTVLDILTAGNRSVLVTNPAPGGGASATINLVVVNPPVPTITSLNPTSVGAGSGAFTLTVNGTGFIPGSVVRWNGAAAAANRTTTFVSSTQLTAVISAADVATAATRPVRVFTPTPGGGTSVLVNFTISAVNNPVPAVTTISPAAATVGSAAFTLTVNGTGFVANSQVRLNGVNRTTTFVSSTQLTAAIPAAAVNTVGSFPVVVVNGAPGGGTSNAVTFVVNPAAPPAITAISPNSVTAGGAAFTLTVNGSNFVNGSVVRVNGVNRTTTFVSSTQLRAVIPAANTAAVASLSVTVFTPATGATSTIASLAVVAPPGATATIQVLETLDFGIKRIGTTKDARITITNLGNLPLVISSVTVGGQFTANLGTCNAVVAVGRTCKLDVSFVPTTAVLSTETLLIFSNVPGSPTPIILTGTGR